MEALTRKPTSVPEGSSASDVGPFRLLVAPDRLKHEAAATKALEMTVSKYRAAGLPLRGRINVAVVGSVRRSYFSPQEGIIRLAVAGLNKDGVDVLIHETAHWQHAYHLPGGYANGRIEEKYWEAMRIKSGPGAGSSRDKLEKQLARLKLQIKALDGKIAAPPEVHKGQVFTMDFSGGRYDVEVIRVLRGGAQVKFVKPDDFTNKYWPEGKVKLEAYSLDRALGADAKEPLKKQRETLFKESQEVYQAYKDAEKGGDRIDGVLNPWVPTRYFT